MSKTIAEYTDSLSIFWLKKHGYLPRTGGGLRGGIKWVYNGGMRENNIGFATATTAEGKGAIQLYYTRTNSFTGEKQEIDYNVRLTTTPCNFGGWRFWFTCPLIVNGVPCGRRVGVLYDAGKYFGCRYCADIAYDAQFSGGMFRVSSVTESRVERAYSEVKQKYYKGKPTRKYKRYLRLRSKMDNSWRVMGARFGNMF